MSNIWAHDMAERMKIRRKVLTKDYGLGDMDVGTFPSEGATHTVIDRGGGSLSGLIATGLLSAALGGGGVLGGMALSSMSPASPAPVVEPELSPRMPLKPIEFDIEIIGTKEGIEASVVPPEN